ncbi:MAG TPA: sigma-70 family RNA polymerase sigma factor, partial [Acidobacteriota bacterium]|nr:sigma-70 family RNA polymerase sigma factor [Acidobacteriota bacterium]
MHAQQSDSELIQRLVSCGDEERKEIFLALYDRYKSLILKVAYHYVKNYDRAGDLMHDVFLRIIKNAGRIKDPNLFKSWVMTITRNLCVDTLRKTSSLIEEDIEGVTIEVAYSDRVEDALIAGMDRRRILEELSGCIRRLEEFDLEVFRLRWQGHKAAQVCKILDAEKAEVRRSYDRMKRILETC